MNNKGQVAILTTVVIAVVVGVVGLTVIEGIASPLYEAQSVTSETFNGTNSSYTNLAESDLVTDSETVYNTTACSTELGGATYTMNYTDGGIIMADNTYDSYDQCIDYNYEDDRYLSDGTTRTVLQNIPILFAIGLLVGAIAWATRN